MNVQTTWVSPARVITGQDHLAVSAISQHLFTELLPGLTNVTQRIRCYSFYPWFVWAFDQRAAKKSANEIVRTFRRAEVLHSLIGILHELDEDDEWPHGGGLVGRDVLVPVARAILDGRTVRLSKYAVLDSENGPRYFKHRLGGLGQYYLGPLRELMVLDGNARSGLRCINEWGGHLAALYDTAVDGDAFFAAIEGDRVDAAVLRKLRAFCPCRLAGSQGERGALGQLMFGTGDGELAQEGGDSRRNTLFALLEYVRDARQNSPRATDEWSFLATACAGALLDGSPWAPSDLLRDVVRQWGVYQDYHYTPNPDLAGWSNDHPFPPEIEVDSPYLQRRLARLVERERAMYAEAAAAWRTNADVRNNFRLWRNAVRELLETHPDGWFPPPVARVEVKQGEAFVEVPEGRVVREPDGSLRAATNTPSHDRITLELPSGWWAALRLELLPSGESTLRGERSSTTVQLNATLRKSDGTAEPVRFAWADADAKAKAEADEKAKQDAAAADKPAETKAKKVTADDARKAFYGWLIGRPYDVAALPAEIAAFEAWKRDPAQPLPDVPFEWLTAFPLTAENWALLSGRIGWQALRMNLNTLARNGAFAVDGVTERVAARLEDKDAIARAGVLPYQLLVALGQVGEGVPLKVQAALETALEHALAAVPAIGGNVVVCPDVSGSMQSPATGVRKGATSKVRCIDIAALVAAAMLRSNPQARVLPFEQRVVPLTLDPHARVAVNAAKLASVGGGGTNVSAPLAQLNREGAAVDLLIIVSDNESWIDTKGDSWRRQGATQTMREWEALKRRNRHAKLVCIDIQPYGSTQAQNAEDIMNVGGFSDDVFETMARFAAGETASWVDRVNEMEV